MMQRNELMEVQDEVTSKMTQKMKIQYYEKAGIADL